MRTALLIAATFTLTAVAEDRNDPKELKKLEGTWVMVSGEVDGKPVAEEHVKKSKITNSKDTTSLEVPHHSPKTVKARFTRVDGSKSPKEIEWLRLEGPNKGTVMLGIYEFDGDDRYKICFDPAGKARPTSFSTKSGSGHIMHVWKRAKE